MTKIEEWEQEDNLIRLQGWARDGLTYEQIAHNMGISLATLKEWRKKSQAISTTLKKSREVVDFEVENALLKNALSGNVTAQIFWLKNRKTNNWREKVEPQENEEAVNNASEILVKIRKTVDDRYERN